jgi:formylglycine-generating enzyme required for sulfatase activity
MSPRSNHGIPARIYSTLRTVLLSCDSFDNDTGLQNIFVHEKLRPWKDRLSSSCKNKEARVDDTIKSLAEEYRDTGENVLVILLRVLTDRTSPENDLHSRLKKIADQLEKALKPKPPSPRNSAKAWYTPYLRSLEKQFYSLPLHGLLEKFGGKSVDIDLLRVYTRLELETKRGGRESVLIRLRKNLVEHFEATKKDFLLAQQKKNFQGLVLLGSPGSGKSTFVRYLALCLADWSLSKEQWTTRLPEHLSEWEGSWKMVPIVLSLRTLAGCLEAKKSDHTDESTIVFASLQEEMKKGRVTSVKLDVHLKSLLQQGGTLLLLDGLDEIPLERIPGHVADRKTTLTALWKFAGVYDRTPMVLTCRERAFDQKLRNLIGWEVRKIAPFSKDQVGHFVNAWYEEMEKKEQITSEQATKYKKTLIEEIEGKEPLSKMAQNPLLLMMMAWILCNETELPRDRSQLYEHILKLLLGMWDKTQDRPGLGEYIGRPDWSSDRVLPILEELSYMAHKDASSKDGTGRLKRWELSGKLSVFFEQEQVSGDPTSRCLDYFDQRSGLLSPDEDGVGKKQSTYVFAHVTLQEHCAGRYLLRRKDATKQVMQHRQDDRWREPLLLGLGVVERENPSLISTILFNLIDSHDEDEQKSPECYQFDLFLAAEIGDDRGWDHLYAQGVREIKQIKRQLKEGLIAVLNERTNPLPVKERVRTGHLLGKLGDPRFPISLDEWKKTINTIRNPEGHASPEGNEYWRFVPCGEYSIGGWKRGEQLVRIPLQAFWIARFPVTVAQYTAFMDAKGYEMEQWWTPNGWKWRNECHITRPRNWDDPRYRGPNQPVVGVSWYEAVAFTRWLNEQISDQVPTGNAIRLPTDAEWEVVAVHNRQGQRLDKISVPTQDRAIDKECGLDHPAPVGCCPAGMTEWGTLDMPGNVWELMTSSYKAYPAKSHEKFEDFARDDYVPRRGQSWEIPRKNNQFWKRCFLHAGVIDIKRIKSTGFRLVIASQ